MGDLGKVLVLIGQLDSCDVMTCCECPLYRTCWDRGDLTIGQVIVEWLRNKGVIDEKVVDQVMVYSQAMVKREVTK